MNLNPDTIILFSYEQFHINATMVFTWAVMLLLTGISLIVTRKLSVSPEISRWQNLLEVLVTGMRKQIQEVSQQEPGRYLPFVGGLFLFIAVSNLLAVVPGFWPPTGSLSTTTALALCVFLAVPLYGISQIGFWRYFVQYFKPTVFMLPFNIIGELS